MTMIDELSAPRAVQHQSSLDRWLDETGGSKRAPPPAPHRLDSPRSQQLHKKLFEWYTQEREIQAENRMQMAIDHDFYDNLQWTEEDANELADRGQAALVYNEIAPTVDWIVGTEKRTRVDFKVLPRTEDDVKTADAKTQVLKWNGDVNKSHFARSLAFSDAVKVGIGWMEDGARGDPTDEPLFSRYEDWRNMLYDSKGRERDTSDWRYEFRIKWTDLDIAETMFPDRKAAVQRAAVAANLYGSEEDEDFWYLGMHYQARDGSGNVIGGRSYTSDSGILFNTRPRVKLIECWYRIPVRRQFITGGEFDGKKFDKSNAAMKEAVAGKLCSVYDRLEMEVRCAIMTEKDMLQDVPSPYKHNRFPFTPIICYRKGRDGTVYGIIRRIRDPQTDLNKRASKALFLLSVNRVIADADAVEDHDEAREEAARPDAYIIKKKGAGFEIQNNSQLAEGHLVLMDRDSRMIKNVGGVNDDNLGRQTNAVSGRAIEARQLQGSVVTAEIFDNLRFSIQCQGEIQLSLCEQFITETKALRITQARGQIQWLRINQPEQDGEGNWRFVNDINATQADFKVDEQDFHQSVRQAMFDSMLDLVGKISQVSPDAGLRILKMALEFSDLPNKTEMAAEIGAILGIETPPDPATMTPEQQQEFAAKQQAKQEQAALEQRQMELAMGEAEAKVAKLTAEANKINAEGEKIMAEAAALMEGGGEDDGAAQAELERRSLEVERKAAVALDDARQTIEELEMKLADRSHEIEVGAETDIKVAKINAKARTKQAEIVAQYRSKVAAAADSVKKTSRNVKVARGKKKASA